MTKLKEGEKMQTEPNPYVENFKEANRDLGRYIQMLQQHYELTDSEMYKIISMHYAMMKALI